MIKIALCFPVISILEFQKYIINFYEQNRELKNYCDIYIISPDIDDIKKLLIKHDHIKYIYDNKTGLGNARNIALNSIDCDIIGFSSIDTFIKKDSLELIKNELRYNIIGTALLTKKRRNKLNRINRAYNYRWLNKFNSGEKTVIGTPFFYRADKLKKIGGFNIDCKFCDDTELGDRIKLFGYTQTYINDYCYEAESTLKEIIDRLKMYGKSDRQYYDNNKNKMTAKNKIKSFFHSIIAEMNYKNKYKLYQLFFAFIRFKQFLKD